MDVKDNIRINLTRLRKENGLTQTDVGMIVDKKKTTVASWEQGKSLPDAETLYRLSVYYHKTLNYMYKAHDEGESL